MRSHINSTTHIYENLISYTLPFAMKQSDLEEHEVMDYLHDFLIYVFTNRKRWVDGECFGFFDLETLNQRTYKTMLTKFFFQFVQRAKYIEGQWIDRRLNGRRTQQECKLGYDLSTLTTLPNSYEIYSYRDTELFLESLEELELKVLSQLMDGETIKSIKESQNISRGKYAKVLKSLQNKAVILGGANEFH